MTHLSLFLKTLSFLSRLLTPTSHGSHRPTFYWGIMESWDTISYPDCFVDINSRPLQKCAKCGWRGIWGKIISGVFLVRYRPRGERQSCCNKEILLPPKGKDIHHWQQLVHKDTSRHPNTPTLRPLSSRMLFPGKHAICGQSIRYFVQTICCCWANQIYAAIYGLACIEISDNSAQLSLSPKHTCSQIRVVLKLVHVPVFENVQEGIPILRQSFKGNNPVHMFECKYKIL